MQHLKEGEGEGVGVGEGKREGDGPGSRVQGPGSGSRVQGPGSGARGLGPGLVRHLPLKTERRGLDLKKGAATYQLPQLSGDV